MTEPDIATIATRGAAPYLILCDHASRMIPDNLCGLGIPEDVLATHIAWDLGAGALAIALGKALNGTVYTCGFSRLIIDPNRAVEAGDLIPAVSDQIPIPGNQMLSAEDRQHRIDVYHAPYHDRLDRLLDELLAAHGNLFVISVHSFTKRLMGALEDRPWELGVLWREDEASAKAFSNHLKSATPWTIGDNEPYDARVFNYTIDRHVGPRALPHLTLELRQDMLADHHDIDNVANIIAEGVEAAARQARLTPERTRGEGR